MITPDTSEPVLPANDIGIVSVEDARLLTPEELSAMFKPKVNVGGKEFSFDLGFITGTANTEQELNGWVNLRVGDELIPRINWTEDQKKNIEEFRQNLSSGSEEEQKLAKEIEDFQSFLSSLVDYRISFDEIRLSSLSDKEKELKISELEKLIKAEEAEVDERIQYLGSLFRRLAKLPDITQDGVAQFLDLSENHKLRVLYIKNLASNIKNIANINNKTEAVEQSMFLNEVSERDIRDGYSSLKNWLNYFVVSSSGQEDKEQLLKIMNLEAFKSFLEKRFPYLVVAESPFTKEKSVMDRIKSIGAYFSTKWKNLTNRPATEVVPEQIEPKLDAIIPEVKIEDEGLALKVPDEPAVAPIASPDLVAPPLMPEVTGAPIIPEVVEAPVEVKIPAGLPSWYRMGLTKRVEPIKTELAPVPAESATEIKPEVVEVSGVKTGLEGDLAVASKGVETKKVEPVSPEAKKAALERINKNLFTKGLDWYDNQPKKVKLAVSATLILAGLAGVAMSSTGLLQGVVAAKYGVRLLSAYGTGKVVEKTLQGKSYANKAKWATMLVTFAIGSYSGDILKSVGGVIGDILPDHLKKSLSILYSAITEELKPVQEELAQKLGTVKDEVVERFNTADKSLNDWREGFGSRHKLVNIPQNGVLPTDVQPTKPQLIPQTPASAPVDVANKALGNVPFENDFKSSDVLNQPATPQVIGMPASPIGPGIEQLVEINPGDSLSEVLMDNIGEKFPGFDELTPKGQANFIYNILSNLDPDQLKEIGVSSMDAGTLSLDDKIDFQKLHDIAQKMEITYGGKSISLFERAKLL